jgi:hypothetical protein
VAFSAERDQIFLRVVTQMTPRAKVVDLKTIGTATVLAPPSIAFQHFDTKFAIRNPAQPKPRSPWSKISH